MEQGYHIAVANSVAMMGFAARDNVLTKELLPAKDTEAQMEVDTDESSPAMVSFRRAQALSNSTFEIVLKRIGDPNVLPFIHVTLVFMYTMARHQGTMAYLQDSFPKQLLAVGFLVVLVRGEWGDAQGRPASARQLLCAGIADRACRLAPVQAKHSLSSAKHVKYIAIALLGVILCHFMFHIVTKGD